MISLTETIYVLLTTQKLLVDFDYQYNQPIHENQPCVGPGPSWFFIVRITFHNTSKASDNYRMQKQYKIYI